MSDNKIFHDVQPEETPRKPFYFPSLILGLLAIACTFFNVASIGQIFGLVGIVLALRRREEYFVIPSLIISALGLGIAFVAFTSAIIQPQLAA